MLKCDFSQYMKPCFLETGSYTGHGIKAAIDAGFKNIYSIELSKKYYDFCTRKFSMYKNVKLFLGDSSVILGEIINKIDNEITFWLDGHYSGGDTACGKEPIPLMDELISISMHPIKTHNILIDDMRLLRCKSNEWKDVSYSEESLISVIIGINEKYSISYLPTKYDSRDILVASIGL